MKEQRIGVIILAAGSSSRLGKPKQLLELGGETLLQHALQVAIGSEADAVFVVIGAELAKMNMVIGKQAVHTIVNEDWQEGIASSIRCGMKSLQEAMPQAEGVVLMLCDQPFVTSDLLNNLILTKQRTGKEIVASTYDGVYGVPALFHKRFFPELLQLRGDIGAKVLIQRHMEDVAAVPFVRGEIDIDTERDYMNLIG